MKLKNANAPVFLGIKLDNTSQKNHLKLRILLLPFEKIKINLLKALWYSFGKILH